MRSRLQERHLLQASRKLMLAVPLLRQLPW
jgi:hypothetical protein